MGAPTATRDAVLKGLRITHVHQHMLTQTNRQEQERKSVEERSSAKKQDEDVEEDARSVPT